MQISKLTSQFLPTNNEQFQAKLSFDFYAIPDANTVYKCSANTESMGFTYLMKLVLCVKHYPYLIAKIKENLSDVNAQNNKGWSALHLACRNSNIASSLEVVQILIDAGAIR
jgi:ankyrin repeat protein